MNREAVAELVRKYLQEHPEEDEANVRLDVLTDGIREDEGWWHVPVRRTPEATRTWKYYEYLTDIEDAIKKDHDDVDVLLIPAS